MPTLLRAKAAEAFEAQLTSLLRDVEIGLHGGGSIDEIFSIKPSVWGISINFKSLWRRLTVPRHLAQWAWTRDTETGLHCRALALRSVLSLMT